MKKLCLVLFLALPLGCQPADDTAPSDSNSTSAAAPAGVVAADQVSQS